MSQPDRHSPAIGEVSPMARSLALIGRAEIEEYRRAVKSAGNELASYDYFANIDRFRHGGSGDLLKEAALLNLLGHTIPGKMNVATALYSDVLGIRQYASMTFAPGQPVNLVSQGQLEFNTWVKPTTTPIEGDAQPFFDLVDLLYDGDIIAAGFYLDSISSLVQKPGTKWAYMILRFPRYFVCQRVDFMLPVFPAVAHRASSP